MEVTGQAFEDMQEQNVRLLQQLREKDDANFKLMSEVSSVSSHKGVACLVQQQPVGRDTKCCIAIFSLRNQGLTL